MIPRINNATQRSTQYIICLWKPVAVSVGLSLLIAIALLGLGGGNSSNALAIEPGSQEEASELTGWFTIQWMDDQNGQLVDVQYMLFDEMGNSIELHFPNLTSIEPPTQLLKLNGRKVTVKGMHRGTGAEKIGQSTFDVLSTGVDETSPSYSGTTSLTGSLPYITLLCEVPGGYAESRPLSYFQNMYGSDKPKLDHYWREISYDAINMNGSDVAGWFLLPHPKDHYLQSDNPYGLLSQDCLAAADADVYFPDYVGINMMFTIDFRYAMGGIVHDTLDGVSRTWRKTYLPYWGYQNLDVVEHEMGHSFGLGHSSGQYGYVYDNEWDVMSRGSEFNQINYDSVYGYIGQHTIAYHKQKLGWIPEARQLTVSWDRRESLELERLAHPNASGFLLATIQLQDDLLFTLETRDLAGYDSGLPGKAVIIHKVVEGYPYIIDPDLNGDTGDDGAMWTSGEVFTSRYGFTITVESETNTGFVVNIDVGPEKDYRFSTCESVAQVSLKECEALISLYENTNGALWSQSPGWKQDIWPCDWYGVECQNDSIVSLDLPHNRLKGPIPAAVGDLANLVELNFAGNALTGSIPSELGNLTNLVELNLAGNALAGSIPSELGNLTNLVELNLAGNALAGSIPTELGDLANLVELNLARNALAGSIPTELGELANLGYLYLDDNLLTGSIPVELARLSNLHWLVLANNMITGNIPQELGTLTGLTALNLAGNKLSGTIPSNLANNSVFLLLNRNQLTGNIPPELANSRIDVLGLSGNQFSGNIPAEFATLSGLDYLDVSCNLLELTDPTIFETLDAQFPEWRSNQTVAPTELVVDDVSFYSVRLAWQPIEYTDGEGRYEIGVRLESDDEYTVVGMTSSKKDSNIIVNGLFSDSTYELAVRTMTTAHAQNPGDVFSQFSQPITVTTRMVSASIYLPIAEK